MSHTSPERRALPLDHGAGDAEVLEGGHPQRAVHVGGRPDESIGAPDGDPRLAGRQHHNHRLDVWDGQA